jgi:hypothetical protein
MLFVGGCLPRRIENDRRLSMSDAEQGTFLKKRYRKNPDVVSREIGDEFILVPICRDVADLESIYTLSGTGGRIWELIDGQLTTLELRDRIVEEFDVEPEDAEADLAEFFQQLTDINGILLVEEN